MKDNLFKKLASNGHVQVGMCFVAAAAIVGVMELNKDDAAPAAPTPSPVPATDAPAAPTPEMLRNAIPVQLVRP